MKRGFAACALFCLSLSFSNANTLAWLRFEGNGDAEGKLFSLHLAPTARFSSQIPGDTVTADGKMFKNSSSYANGQDSNGSLMPANAAVSQAMANGNFTVECFVCLDAGADKARYLRIAGDSRVSSKDGWALGIDNGALSFSATQGLNSGRVNLVTNQILKEGVWYHVAVVGYRAPDRLTLRLFINGEEQELKKLYCCFPAQPGGAAIVPSDEGIIVGGVNAFQGAIDELRISDAALDPDEFLKASSLKQTDGKGN